MIHPAIRIVDVDPVGFASLCTSLARRDRGPRREVSVAHRGGAVRAVAATFAADLGLGPGDGVDDIRTAAGEVRQRTGADVVTFIDEVAMAGLSPQLSELARSSRSQGELLWRARLLWQQHPAVVIDPEPGPPRWPAVADVISSVPDGEWIVFEVVGDDGEHAFRLAGEVDDGLLVTITSAPPSGAVALTVQAPAAVFDALLAATDPWTELERRRGDGTLTFTGRDPLST